MSEIRFKLKFPIVIRFSDLDSLGHVNNAIVLTYFEEARMQYFDTVVNNDTTDWSEQGVIVARAVIDFRKPIMGYDHYYIHISCSRLGNKSFDFSYRIIFEKEEQAEIMCEGMTVMVCFNYKENRTIDIPAEWKSKVAVFEELEEE